KPACVECPEVAGLDEPLVVRFGDAQVIEVHDPQKTLKEASCTGNMLRAVAAGRLGHRTAFARLEQGDLFWWAPIAVEIRPPSEICRAGVDWSSGGVEFVVRNNTDKPLAGSAVVRCGGTLERIDLRAPPRSESAPIRLPAKDLVPGTNPIAMDFESGETLRGAVVDWRALPAEATPAFECVDLSGFHNDRVSEIFKAEYRSPRSPCCSLQIPLHGFGDWCYGGMYTPTIDDSALRQAAGDAGRFVGPQGIPLATPGPGDGPNVVFTSRWDNFPNEVEIRLAGRSEHIWLLVAGSTHPMQSQLDNGEVVVTYADGTSEQLPLHNPTTWWPIEGDYDVQADGFCIPGPRPPRIDLGTGKATLLDLPLDPTRELRSLTVRCLANDVVVGLMSATLLRPR
ncbi:MAG: glycogen debranching protein, partial [Pirellulaceae bacterium]|nr:glycogen debranching protein [Pirellulaceae bacterium]